jgi:hypothetical protein
MLAVVLQVFSPMTFKQMRRKLGVEIPSRGMVRFSVFRSRGKEQRLSR